MKVVLTAITKHKKGRCKLFHTAEYAYRKPPTISPGLIFFRKRFLMAYTSGGLYTGGGAYTGTIFCVSNKEVSHKQENKHVLITRFD
jgi:hypothetical protein